MSPGTHDPLGGRVVLKRVGFLPRIHHPATEKTSTYSGRDRGTRVAVTRPSPFVRFAVAVFALFCKEPSMPLSQPGKTDIRPATGKLGILLPGMGAVATTFIAGVEAIRRGISKPIGSLTQMGTIRLGKRTDNRSPAIGDFVPLAKLQDLVFGGWDLFPDHAYEAATKAGVLSKEHLGDVKDFLTTIK